MGPATCNEGPGPPTRPFVVDAPANAQRPPMLPICRKTLWTGPPLCSRRRVSRRFAAPPRIGHEGAAQVAMEFVAIETDLVRPVRRAAQTRGCCGAQRVPEPAGQRQAWLCGRVRPALPASSASAPAEARTAPPTSRCYRPMTFGDTRCAATSRPHHVRSCWGLYPVEKGRPGDGPRRHVESMSVHFFYITLASRSERFRREDVSL